MAPLDGMVTVERAWIQACAGLGPAQRLALVLASGAATAAVDGHPP